jgi:hypothetical protein
VRGIAGPTGSTSSRRAAERGAAARALRFYQFLLLQAVLVAALLGGAWLGRASGRTVALCLVTLVVPVGWGLAFGLARARVERALQAGTWTAAWEQSVSRRALGALGGIMLVWALAAVLIALYG